MGLWETQSMNVTALKFSAMNLDLRYNKRKSVWTGALISKAIVLKLFVHNNGGHNSHNDYFPSL